MDICHISRRGCIRVIKECLALQEKGHRIFLLCQNAPFGSNQFDQLSIYFDKEHLQKTVAISSADVFHCHNEPDWMVAAVKEAAGNRPVIFDCHDLMSVLKNAEPDADEKAAFAAADGIVHPSGVMKELAEHYHGNSKPTLVLPPLVNERFYSDPIDPHWRSIVYEGALSSAPVIISRDNDTGRTEISFRSWQDVAKMVVEQGYIMHLYAASDLAEDDLTYAATGAIVYDMLHYPVLMNALRIYGYGLVGAPISVPIIEGCMPNKLYEYIAQGVVPIVLNAACAAAFVESSGLGIVLNGIDNLEEQLSPGPEVRKNILAQRKELTMEKYIYLLEQLYEAVLSKAKGNELTADIKT